MKTIEKSQISRMLLIAGFLFFCNFIFADGSSVIKGHVMDSKKQPLNYATATLMNPTTMEIVEGDMCNYKGEFKIENVKPGEYILSVRMVGFAKDETVKVVVDPAKNQAEEINIVLKESVQQLNEVVVTAARPQTQSKLDVGNNTTVNIQKDNMISGLINQLDNYLKELQSKNVDAPETHVMSSFRSEVERFMVNQFNDIIHSSIRMN